MTTKQTLLGMSAALALALTTTAAQAEVSKADVAKADDIAKTAKSHYNLAEYDDAITAYKDAYRINPKSSYLYNIAQAYRQKGDCAASTTFYKNYLRAEPEASDRAKVEGWIEEMKTCPAPTTGTGTTGTGTGAGTTGTGTGTTGTGTGTTGTGTGITTGTGTGTGLVDPGPGSDLIDPGTDPGTDTGTDTGTGTGAMLPPPEGRPPTGSGGGGLGGMRIAGIATMGVGLVGLGAGTFFALSARAKSNEVAAACNDADGCDWSMFARLDEAGHTAATRGKLAFAIGGAAVIGGAVLFVLGGKKSQEAPSVAFAPTADGTGAIFVRSGTF